MICLLPMSLSQVSSSTFAPTPRPFASSTPNRAFAFPARASRWDTRCHVTRVNSPSASRLVLMSR